jgi:hypothetical protein
VPKGTSSYQAAWLDEEEDEEEGEDDDEGDDTMQDKYVKGEGR